MSAVTRSFGPTRYTLMGLALLMALAAPAAQATDIRQWQREPIAIDLPVGAERIVVFDRPVRVGLPPAIADPALLRVQSTDGAVYFKAKKPFDTQRVQIQVITTGEIVLVDLTAKPHASDETIKVAFADEPAAASPPRYAPGQTARRPLPRGALTQSGTGAPTPVRLVRHAAQALYAPQRLADGARGIHRRAVAAPDTLPGLLPAYPVDARPLAVWRAAPYTVTAIQITNRDPMRHFTLDPRALAGDFYAASFMHQTLGPAGTLADTTTLFAVTKNGGLVDALAPTVRALAEASDAD